MIKLKKNIQEIIVDEVVGVSCDVCSKNISEDSLGLAKVSSLMLFKGPSEIIENRFENYSECETTDLCSSCYDKTVGFLKSICTSGQNIPSYTENADEEEDDIDDYLSDMLWNASGKNNKNNAH